MNKEEIEKTVTNPPHYAGVTVEPIDVAQCYGFLMGNAIKYLVRAGKKEGASEESDLRKAKFYLERWRTFYGDCERSALRCTKDNTFEDAKRSLAARIWLIATGNKYLRKLFQLDCTDTANALPNEIDRAGVLLVLSELEDELKAIEKDEADA